MSFLIGWSEPLSCPKRMESVACILLFLCWLRSTNRKKLHSIAAQRFAARKQGKRHCFISETTRVQVNTHKEEVYHVNKGTINNQDALLLHFPFKKTIPLDCASVQLAYHWSKAHPSNISFEKRNSTMFPSKHPQPEIEGGACTSLVCHWFVTASSLIENMCFQGNTCKEESWSVIKAPSASRVLSFSRQITKNPRLRVKITKLLDGAEKSIQRMHHWMKAYLSDRSFANGNSALLCSMNVPIGTYVENRMYQLFKARKSNTSFTNEKLPYYRASIAGQDGFANKLISRTLEMTIP